MPIDRLAALVLPSANRVYADASVDLLAAETQIVGDSLLDGRVGALERRELGGLPYVTFGVTDLGDRDVRALSNLSSLYALFRLGDGGALRPVAMEPLACFDDDLLTIPKYAGKTNEQFTKLLLNVTIMASASAPRMLDDTLHVLDPVCGRGSTLNQALMYGYDATGIETDGKDVDAYEAFVKTYLKRKRIKHTAESARVRREGRVLGRRLDVTLGLTKEAYKAGDVRHLSVVNADTLRSRDIFGAASFDVVVGDLPYGVQHGSRGSRGDLSRSPLDLLREAVPVWVEVLRPGGAIGLSWNTHVASREDASAVLTEAGLRVRDDGGYERLRHRVDQAIDRDVLVAVRD